MDKISSKEINRLAFPSILTGLAEPIVSITDTAIVGKIDHQSMSAVGLGSLLVMVLVWLLSSVKGAISSLIGQHHGKGNIASTHQLVAQTILFIMCVSLLLCTVTFFFSTSIFSGFYGAEGAILKKSTEYYSWRIFAVPFMLGTYVIFGVMKGLQNTSYAMIITITGAALNIVLDLILVPNYGALPAMGVKGAAIASAISQIVMFVMAIYLLMKKFGYRLRIRFPIDHEIPRMLLMSLDLLIRTALLNLVVVLSNRFATKMGDEHIAAHTIAAQLWLFSAYFIDGFANAGIALISKLKGQQNNTSIYTTTISLILRGLMIAGISVLIFLIINPYLGHIFNDDPKVILQLSHIFIIVLLLQPFNAIAFILDGVYIGLGNMTAMRNSMIISTLVGFLVTWFAFGKNNHELLLLWISLLIWMVFRAGTLTYSFLNTYSRYRTKRSR